MACSMTAKHWNLTPSSPATRVPKRWTQLNQPSAEAFTWHCERMPDAGCRMRCRDSGDGERGWMQGNGQLKAKRERKEEEGGEEAGIWHAGGFY